jgi:CheY-like chemotaxis protein
MTRSILVADPSATIRRVVELSLADGDYYVECAATGAEALARVARLAPDLVLADVGSGEPSGYEICRSIKLSARPVPVLLLVGAFEAFDEARARACGADGRLAKPFEARQLRDEVERLLGAARGAPAAALASASSGSAAAVPAPLAELAGVEALVRATVERLAEPLVREVAREILPRIAERVVRERIRELENEESSA